MVVNGYGIASIGGEGVDYRGVLAVAPAPDIYREFSVWTGS